MKNTIRLLLFVSLLILSTTLVSLATEAYNGNSKHALVVRVEGILSTIDVPTKEYVVDEGLRLAEEQGVPLIIVVDSYGGYMDAMYDIADAILHAKTPVIGFVKDRAYSAACIMLLPTHILAVTPSASMGAAQPVMINQATGEVKFVNESKIINPLIKRIELYASSRGRNVTAAKLFVLKNLVLTGRELVENGIADLIASDLDDLISKIRGRIVKVEGANVTIDIDGYTVLDPSVRILVYAFLRNPIVNSVLWFLGVFGTFVAIVSGRIEVLPFTGVLLILALISSGVNVNVLALLLLILGSAMLAVEIFITPGFGILGISGIIALAIGILLLPIRSNIYMANYEDIRNTVIVVCGGLGAVFGLIAFKAAQVLRRGSRVAYTPERSTKVGRVVERIEPGKRGTVFVDGEYWYAESDEVIEPGEEVEIIERRGLVLKVRRRRSR